jgi:hypothetical protein
MTEQQTPEPRQIVLDDVSYLVSELPEAIQQYIATYDIWMLDKAAAQRQAVQLDAAVRHLSQIIATALKEHAAAQAAAAEAVPEAGDVAPVATLDIPADVE